MVLCLKTRESRSLPGLPIACKLLITIYGPPLGSAGPQTLNRVFAAFCLPKRYENSFAGWSSPVARQAHNLKAAGSNPAPATKMKPASAKAVAGFLLFEPTRKTSSAQFAIEKSFRSCQRLADQSLSVSRRRMLQIGTKPAAFWSRPSN